MVEVVPPSPPMTFHVVPRAPPPLAPLVSGFPLDSQLAAPVAPDFAETRDHIGMILGPNGHEVQVAPPHGPFLATDKASRNRKRK
jgi:hypothetical protein